MSAVIVANGALVEVKCPSRLSRSTEQQVSFSGTLGGKRKGFVRPGGRREWSIDVSLATPVEFGTIEAIAGAGMQVGWYGPDAAIGNLLSPQTAAFLPLPANATDAGLTVLPHGQVARSVLHTGSYITLGPRSSPELVPVRDGQPLAVGAWGMDGLRITGVWYDASGVRLGTVGTDTWTFSGWQWREQALAPPPGAAGFEFRLLGGLNYAAPSASWGLRAKQEPGLGCPAAVLHSPSVSPLALREQANLSQLSYTVTEVG